MEESSSWLLPKQIMYIISRGDDMSVPKDTWKIIGDAREYYMTIDKSFHDMDKDEQSTWLEITKEIEHLIKLAKSGLDSIMNPEEHKKDLHNKLNNQGK
jgi:hypothetical protein